MPHKIQISCTLQLPGFKSLDRDMSLKNKFSDSGYKCGKNIINK